MDVNRIACEIKRFYIKLRAGINGANPGLLTKAAGLALVMLGVFFVIYFCIVGYPDQDEIDDLRELPAIVQFLATSPVYIGMFFILLGSVLLTGGHILSAIDMAYRHSSQHIAEINCQLDSIKSNISTSRTRADDKPPSIAERETGQRIVEKALPKPEDQELPASVVKSKHLRIWPFSS